MGQYEMRARLEELIGAERGRVLPGWLHSYGVRLLAEHLLAAGVLVPPVKEGQTVYAALFEGDDAEIYPWQVQGIAHVQDKWYAVEKDGSEWEVGAACCFLTEQAAEEYKKQETKRRTVEDLRPQSVSTCSQSEDSGPYKEEKKNDKDAEKVG